MASLISDEKLRRISILSGLSGGELSALRQRLTVSRLGKGETIIGYLDEGTDLILLLEGEALVNRYSAAGREVGFRRIRAEAYLGELAIFDGEPRSVNILAHTEVEIGRIPGRAFRELLHSSPAMAEQLFRDLAQRIRSLSERVFETTASSVKMRLYYELVRAALAENPQGERVLLEHPPTHAEWAALIGGQRETITRCLSELTAIGLLEKQGRNLVITDLDRLLELAEAE